MDVPQSPAEGEEADQHADDGVDEMIILEPPRPSRWSSGSNTSRTTIDRGDAVVPAVAQKRALRASHAANSRVARRGPAEEL